MLLNKYIKIKWHPAIKKWYENKGYIYTKIGDEFEVNVDDLQDGSCVKIDVQCDNCNKLLKDVIWYKYKKYVKEDGNYYCRKCGHKLFAGEKSRIMRLKNSKSFEQWCIENNRQDVLDRWDYDLNDLKPREIGFSSTGKNKKGYYFKCPRKIHKSELKKIDVFIRDGYDGSISCKQCNSFAQWNIDNLDENFLEKYWDYEKNTVDPWKISHSCSNKVWIKCQLKQYHGSYKISCGNFKLGNRCIYCINYHGKVHELDSLGTLYPEVLSMWSDKNEKTPYDYAPKSGQEVWWKCPEGIHEDYKRKILNSNTYNFRCPECQYSKGEERISKYLILNDWIKISQSEFCNLGDNKNIYIPQMTFDGLVGIGDGLLSYDFYLPNKHNLLIEYQGEYHDGNTRNQSKEDVKRQQEHDKRKREYAENNNIKLLEIWYWEFDKIEEILELHLNNS